MALDVRLRSSLEEMDAKFGGDNMVKMLGPTLLSYTSTDSARMYMFSSHIKQTLELLNPDIPRLQTGFEKTFGKYSHGFKQLKGNWEVKAIIRKYKNGPIYTMVLYNKQTDTYDMLEKKVAEALTEKFGYVYNTSVMDGLDVGDKIENPILYRSTAFDEHMNYRYGKNARVHYSASTDTLEDAIIIRRSWADSVKSVEIDTIQVSINDNDIPLNLYGSGDTYQPFPHLGERVRNSVICATRKFNKNHLLYDFQKSNMREICSTDTEYYTSKDAEVYDINIYYNNDKPFPDNLFYQQLKQYYDEAAEYAAGIAEWAQKIKSSGSKYTQNVTFLLSEYQHYNDPSYKWKNKDKAFANMMVEFKVRHVVSLGSGSKLTGRYGDKGVISRICEDVVDTVQQSIIDMIKHDATSEEREKLIKSIIVVDDDRMVYTDDYPVDIELNLSGSIRRLNPGQLMEVEVNFIAERLQLELPKMKSRDEKEEAIFKFLSIVNAKQAKFFKDMYDRYDYTETIDKYRLRIMDDAAKDRFISSIERDGFYLVRPPHMPLTYDIVKQLYEAFPHIGPLPLYIDLFGIKHRRVLKDGIVGWKYILILKQNSNKNFSARSTFRVNRVNLPAKDTTKKTNRSAYAKTPINLSEIYNILSATSGRTLAEYDIFTRSSAIGRQSLKRILETDSNPLSIKKIKLSNAFINTNAQILGARLKAIGIKLKFHREMPELGVYPIAVTEMHIGPYTVFDYPSTKQMYTQLFDLFNQWRREHSFIDTTPGEGIDYAWDYVFNLDEVKAMELSEETKDILRVSTRGVLLRAIKEQQDAAVVATIDVDGTLTEVETAAPIPKKRGRKPKAK